MKVKVTGLTDEGCERRDYRDVLEISIDGKRAFQVFDGEPEDATLSRDFNDCYSIPEMMQKAYEAGKNGETFKIENVKLDEF